MDSKNSYPMPTAPMQAVPQAIPGIASVIVQRELKLRSNFNMNRIQISYY